MPGGDEASVTGGGHSLLINSTLGGDARVMALEALRFLTPRTHGWRSPHSSPALPTLAALAHSVCPTHGWYDPCSGRRQVSSHGRLRRSRHAVPRAVHGASCTVSAWAAHRIARCNVGSRVRAQGDTLGH